MTRYFIYLLSISGYMRIPLTPFSIEKTARLSGMRRDLRRMRQFERSGRLSSESTRTWLRKETFSVYDHMETGAPETRTIEVIENWAANILQKDQAIIYVSEGKDAKQVLQVDFLIQGQVVRRIDVFKQYPTIEQAMLEELVVYPQGANAPKRPKIKRFGRNVFEEAIIGPTALEFFAYLRENPSDKSFALRDAVINRLLDNQACFQALYYQADPPLVSEDQQRLARTAAKLASAFEEYLYVNRKTEEILRRIGYELDSHAVVPYRDAWLPNSSISLEHMLISLDMKDAAKDLISRTIHNTRAYELLNDVAQDDLVLECVDAIYQNDSGNINYMATEERDRLHILFNPVLDLSPDEIAKKEAYYRTCYANWGGRPTDFQANLPLALFNHHIRCAYTYKRKTPVDNWKVYHDRHFSMAQDVLEQCDSLGEREIGYLHDLLKVANQ